MNKLLKTTIYIKFEGKMELSDNHKIIIKLENKYSRTIQCRRWRLHVIYLHTNPALILELFINKDLNLYFFLHFFQQFYIFFCIFLVLNLFGIYYRLIERL